MGLVGRIRASGHRDEGRGQEGVDHGLKTTIPYSIYTLSDYQPTEIRPMPGL